MSYARAAYVLREFSIVVRFSVDLLARYSDCILGVSTFIIWQPWIDSSISPNVPARLRYLAGHPSRAAIARPRS